MSDCTSDGSRSHIFSRFTGVFYLGFAIGPTLGAFFIRHPLLNPDSAGHPDTKGVPTVTTVFWIAIMCSCANLLLSAFVFPESLGKAQLKAAKKAFAASLAAVDDGASPSGDSKQPRGGVVGFVMGFFSPLMVFAPRKTDMGGKSLRKRRDWSLTWLGCALFAYMLSMVGWFLLCYLRTVVLMTLVGGVVGRVPAEVSVCRTCLRMGCRAAELLHLVRRGRSRDSSSFHHAMFVFSPASLTL